MTLEPLLWIHCSRSGRCLLEYIIGTQSPGELSSNTLQVLQRDFFFDSLLVRIHFIIKIIE